MNYRFSIARYGYTWEQVVRIGAKLALHTGVNRLIWINQKGRAHIIMEGQGGYQHTEKGLVGHVPTCESVDFRNAGLCEFQVGNFPMPSYEGYEV